jgi:D-aminoacyl-tRNA deacylase
MKVLLQRVSQASVKVENQMVGSISHGWLAFVGFHISDQETTLSEMLEKIINLRLFADENGKFNLSLLDVGGSLLIVSQFTLYADTKKGRRPSFTESAPPPLALPLYEKFITLAQSKIKTVATGRFGADMKVDLTNDGPVTVMLELP